MGPREFLGALGEATVWPFAGRREESDIKVKHDDRGEKMSRSAFPRGCFAQIAGVILSIFFSQAQAAEKLAVQTGSLDGVHAALFLALQKAWFREAGFDVSIMDGKGSATAIQQVSAGQGDVAYSQLATMAAAIDHGMDLISIACFVRAGDNGVMVGSQHRYQGAQGSRAKAYRICDWDRVRGAYGRLFQEGRAESGPDDTRGCRL